MNDDKYEWITGELGPHLILERKLLPYWTGSVLDKDSGKEGGDNSRIYEIKGYVEILSIGPRSGLVLSGASGDTAWFPEPNGNGGKFVTWLGADSEEQVFKIAQGLPETFWEKDSLIWHIETKEVVLFGSAVAGREVDDFDHLNFTLRPGRYLVQAGTFESADVIVVFYRLQLQIN